MAEETGKKFCPSHPNAYCPQEEGKGQCGLCGHDFSVLILDRDVAKAGWQASRLKGEAARAKCEEAERQEELTEIRRQLAAAEARAQGALDQALARELALGEAMDKADQDQAALRDAADQAKEEATQARAALAQALTEVAQSRATGSAEVAALRQEQQAMEERWQFRLAQQTAQEAKRRGRLQILLLGSVLVGVLLGIQTYRSGTGRLSAPADSGKAGPLSAKACSECPEEVVIPAGRFVMGSEKSEGGTDDERDGQGRTHEVTIAYRLAVGRTEVTFAEWDACVVDGGCSHKPKDEWGRGRQPVMRVSWDDINQQYLPWLNRKAGYGASDPYRYRLLTEAEWEYAARAGTTGPFSVDGPITWEKVNYDANYSYQGSPKGTYRQKTVEAGSLPANPWGLREMHGNVWEWVQDCWHESYDHAPADGHQAWQAENGGDCSRRLLRGGSWHDFPGGTRSANRNRYGAVSRYDRDRGFRLARTISP